MDYLFANVFAWIVIILLGGLGFLLDKEHARHPKIIEITVIALLITVSVVLTNVISYQITVFGSLFRFQFGIFVLVSIGMLFGPYYGWIAGITTDTLGVLVNIGGVYNALYTLDDVIFAFIGSLVFFKKTRFWELYFGLLFAISFAVVSFGLDVWAVIITYKLPLKALLIAKLIKYPFEIIFYVICTLGFMNFCVFILHKNKQPIILYCERDESLKFFFFKSKYLQNEKYQVNNNDSN